MRWPSSPRSARVRCEWSPHIVASVVPQAHVARGGGSTVADGVVSAWTAGDQSSSGAVTIERYDADAKLMCGAMDIVTANGGRIAGTYSAEVYCR